MPLIKETKPFIKENKKLVLSIFCQLVKLIEL